MSILVKPYGKFAGVCHYTKKGIEYIRWYERFKEFSRPLKNVNLEEIESKTNKHTDIFELPIKDITERHIKNFRYVQRCVDYDIQEVIIDPYIFGLWLGDGNSRSCGLTTVDLPVKNIWCDYLKNMGLNVQEDNKKNRNSEIKSDESDHVVTYFGRTMEKTTNGCSKPNTNPFLNELRRLNVFGAKHIPEIYLKNSKENRLKLLAGLIDTDGTLAKGTSYSITQKREILSNNIAELCKSLGFFTNVTSQTKRCTNSPNPNHIDTYYRVDIFITFHTPTIPLQIVRKLNISPKPGQNSNFQKFDINGNPEMKRKNNDWTDEKTQKLYNIVGLFKQLEPGQMIPWNHIRTMDRELNMFTPDALRKQYQTIIKTDEPNNYPENTMVLKHEDFIENEWFDKYNNALKHLDEHFELLVHTPENVWYYNQRNYYDSMYIIKKQLLDRIQEKLPKSKREYLIDNLNNIKERYHNGERIENISLVNDRLYIPSTTKYNNIGKTVQDLQTAIKRGKIWNGYETMEYIEMYKPLLHEIHLDPNINKNKRLIYRLLPESDKLVDFYYNVSDATKSMIREGNISSYSNGKRKISQASNVQGVEYGYKWIDCSLPGVYNF